MVTFSPDRHPSVKSNSDNLIFLELANLSNWFYRTTYSTGQNRQQKYFSHKLASTEYVKANNINSINIFIVRNSSDIATFPCVERVRAEQSLRENKIDYRILEHKNFMMQLTRCRCECCSCRLGCCWCVRCGGCWIYSRSLCWWRICKRTSVEYCVKRNHLNFLTF